MSLARTKTRPRLSRVIETIGSAGDELSGSERWLLVIIASHSGGFAVRSHPGNKRLSDLSGFDPRSVRRLIASCEAKGWLDVDRQKDGAPQTANRYLVTPSAEAKERVAELQRDREAKRKRREARWREKAEATWIEGP